MMSVCYSGSEIVFMKISYIESVHGRHRLRIRRKRIRSLGSTSTTGGSCDKMVNRFPDMDTYFTEINHVLLASRGYLYDGFLFS